MSYLQIKCVQTILMHGFSSVVTHVMIKAVQRGVRFNVIVTEGHSGKTGQSVKEILEQSNIATKLISNAAVGIIMPKVDCIFVGCESVLENGGIMNKVGTFTVALCAKTFQKPFYVFTESLKFMKEFPLKPVRIKQIRYYRMTPSNWQLNPQILKRLKQTTLHLNILLCYSQVQEYSHPLLSVMNLLNSSQLIESLFIRVYLISS